MAQRKLWRVTLSAEELSPRLMLDAGFGPPLPTLPPPGGDWPAHSDTRPDGGQLELPLPRPAGSSPVGPHGLFRPDQPGGQPAPQPRDPLNQKDPNFASDPHFASLDDLVRYHLARRQTIRSGGRSVGTG